MYYDEQQDYEPEAATKVLTSEELQQLYEEQQRRLACPGCGEEPFT
jgi:hypothetical protein